jgi:hypothetical protein
MEIRKRPGDERHVWHTQQEKVLKEWSEVGASYRYMHDRAYARYNSQNLRFALPVIIISTVTGTANFAQASFPESWQPYVPLCIGFFNLTAGLITTIAQFLRVSELLEGHRAASIAYSKFSRNISVELSLPDEQRTCGGLEFINKARYELDRLIEQSPNIPLGVVKQFGVKFKHYNFIKPQILEITTTEIYKENSEEREEREREVMARFEEKKNTIIKEENDKRAAIKDEFEKETQAKTVELEAMLALAKTKKKKGIAIHSITNNMSQFISRLNKYDDQNSTLTPDSSVCSDSDEEYPTSQKENKVIHAEPVKPVPVKPVPVKPVPVKPVPVKPVPVKPAEPEPVEPDRVVIDIKEKVIETKKKLLPIDISGNVK